MRAPLYLLVLLPLLPGPTVAQGEPKDRLLIYGEGWAIAVQEPAGWHGDSQTGAARWEANLILWRDSTDLAEGRGLIRVTIVDKTDENTAADLAADMDAYRKQYPGIQFEDLSLEHPAYAVFSKVFVLPGQFREYVVYLNPGPRTSYLISVSTNYNDSPDDLVLSAYRQVVRSLMVVQ